MASDKIVTLTQENWDKEVLQADVPVLVDFWATWCAPCMREMPTLGALQRRFAGRLLVIPVSADEDSKIEQAKRDLASSKQAPAKQAGAKAPTASKRVTPPKNRPTASGSSTRPASTGKSVRPNSARPKKK